MCRPITLLFSLLLLLPISAVAGTKEDDRATHASQVLTEVLRIPEDSIPTKLFNEAQAIAVLPGVGKLGFVFGGSYGKGLIAVRGKDGTWSNPSFIKLTSGSIGFQAGVQSADIILVFRTTRAIDSIVNGQFTLGGDASVAAGPVGRSAKASTDETFKAEIYSYSRARGLFAGIAIDGAVIQIDNKANSAVYGKDTTARMILEGRASKPSDAVVGFRDKLEESTAKATAPAK